MTRREYVNAYCTLCASQWVLTSAVANTLAQEQGLSGRLQRRGTAMEQLGATFTPFVSGRRIAAGNEVARQQQNLAQLYQLAACPACGSTDIMLSKP